MMLEAEQQYRDQRTTRIIKTDRSATHPEARYDRVKDCLRKAMKMGKTDHELV